MDCFSLYYGLKKVFGEIILLILQGFIIVLIGFLGCGKISFLYCFNWLIDFIFNCLVYGDVWLDDFNIFYFKIDIIVLRCQIGMVLQKLNFFLFLIWKNIVFLLKEYGIVECQEID